MLNQEIKKPKEIVISVLDLDRYRDFITDAHYETFRITFESEISEEFLKEEFIRMQNDCMNNEGSVVGAFIEGEIAGLAVLEIRERSDCQYGWIHFYYVAPEFRKLGVGKKLVDFSVSFYRSRGLSEICLRTGENNIITQAFYTKNGFVRVPEEDRISLFGVTEFFMKLEIDV